jgi:hypothetical protein
MYERGYRGAYKSIVTQTQTSLHATYISVNWHYCQYRPYIYLLWSKNNCKLAYSLSQVISVTTRRFTRMPAWYNQFSPALTIVQIHLPDIRCLESGVMSKYILWLVVTFRWTENRTVPGFLMSQQMISESLRPPLSSLVPSGENCRCVIPPLWPSRRYSNDPFGSEYTPGM